MQLIFPMNTSVRLSSVVLLGILFGLSPLPAADELIFQESFETDGNGTRYTLVGGHDDGDDNYVARRQAGDLGIPTEQVDGEWVFGFRDIDFAEINTRINGDLYEAEGLTRREARLKFEEIDISGMGNLRVAMSVANLGGGNESNDNLSIRARFDGGEWVEIGGFKSPRTNAPPVYYAGRLDTIIHYTDPTTLSPTFADWSWPITGHGSTMELQITVAGNAGNEDHHLDNIRLYGNPDLDFVTAAFSIREVTEPESGEVGNMLTLTLDSPAPEGGVTLGLEPEDRFAATSLELPSESVTIPAGEQSIEVPVQIVQDNRYTGTKEVAILVQGEGYNPAIGRVRVGNVTPRPHVLITEVLTIVPGWDPDEHLFGDANGDGVMHRGADLFAEIMNLGDAPIDISDWRISSTFYFMHQFAEGTILQPGQAAVVFGWGTPTGGFGGAIVTTSITGPTFLGFSISPRIEEFTLKAPFGAEVDQITDLANQEDMIAISAQLPEGHAGKGLTASFHRLSMEQTEPGFELSVAEHLHSIIEGAEERLFSPGTWFDGTVYSGKGWTRLPVVFTEIAYNAGDGWFWDSTFGWIYIDAPDWDLPWVYVEQGKRFWYVVELNGLWAYDYALSSWCYTDYGLYPWIWQYSLSDWIDISEE